MEAAAESASDVVGRAFWWSNCIQLRWMLWAMSHGGSLDSEYGQELGGSVDDFDWVMQVRSAYPSCSLVMSQLGVPQETLHTGHPNIPRHQRDARRGLGPSKMAMPHQD